jgi:hypothetical protein
MRGGLGKHQKFSFYLKLIQKSLGRCDHLKQRQSLQILGKCGSGKYGRKKSGGEGRVKGATIQEKRLK